QEARDAAMPGGARVGASEQDPAIADPRSAAPHLLTVDHEASAAVGLGARRQGREVAPRPRLGEQLTPDNLAARRRRQVGGLLFGSAVRKERLGDEDQPD